LSTRLKQARLEDATAALERRQITVNGTTLKFLERRFGEQPPNGHSLWISLHGGGNTSPEVNDQQWHNQVQLYEPEEGYYVAPRAPNDTWNLWHQAHIDPLLTQLIEHYVVAKRVNPDRVYLIGYSAGGDGVYQLAPRIPDRFAAAAMMAGHPNETSPLGLRNLPFAVLMGGDDSAYNRADTARAFGDRLKDLRDQDPFGYTHNTIIYPGLGHWMQGKDAEILPWLASFSRNTRPDRIVWKQDDVTHTRFYWLRIPDEQAKPRAKIVASIQDQTVLIETNDYTSCTLLLHDKLLDLDKPINVVVNSQTVFQGHARRTELAINQALEERLDPSTTPTTTLKLSW